MARPKKNPKNEGTINQRKDGRWEGKAYVLTTDGTYKRRSVYGKTWDEAHEKLTKPRPTPSAASRSPPAK